MDIVSRSKWNAAAPKVTPSRISSTADGLFVHHSVAEAPEYLLLQDKGLLDRNLTRVRRRLIKLGLLARVKAAEKAECRDLQQIGFSRGFNDISYSFVVMPSGRVYEGRGRGVEQAATYHYNDTSHSAVLAGDYQTLKPSKAQKQALTDLKEWLGATKVRGHRDVNSTDCPGDKAYELISQI